MRLRLAPFAYPLHEPKECAGSLLNMQQGYRSRGSGQPQKLCFPRWSRPHSFVHSEHQPKGVRRQQKGRKEAERASPHLFAHSEHQPKGVRRQQKGRKEAERAGRDRASARKAVPSSQLSTLGLGSGAVGVVASHALSTREGPGSIPGLSMPMCALVGLSRLGFAVRLAKGGCCAAAGCRTSLLNPL